MVTIGNIEVIIEGTIEVTIEVQMAILTVENCLRCERPSRLRLKERRRRLPWGRNWTMKPRHTQVEAPVPLTAA